jgi:hypothetical protein
VEKTAKLLRSETAIGGLLPNERAAYQAQDMLIIAQEAHAGKSGQR